MHKHNFYVAVATSCRGHHRRWLVVLLCVLCVGSPDPSSLCRFPFPYEEATVRHFTPSDDRCRSLYCIRHRRSVAVTSASRLQVHFELIDPMAKCNVFISTQSLSEANGCVAHRTQLPLPPAPARWSFISRRIQKIPSTFTSNARSLYEDRAQRSMTAVTLGLQSVVSP